MSRIQAYWKSYWQTRDQAQHRYSTEDWLAFYANELLLYCPSHPVRALEIGCGNGDLYPYMRSRFSSYVGVDLSQAMIAKYSKRWPELELIQANSSEIEFPGRKFDFIFSNGVCQYWNKTDLERNLAVVRKLLESDGTCLIANIPDAHLRFYARGGGLRGDLDFSTTAFIRACGKKLLRLSDGIGFWYTRRQLTKVGLKCGFSVRTYSSASYEYRFHAVLQHLEEDPN